MATSPQFDLRGQIKDNVALAISASHNHARQSYSEIKIVTPYNTGKETYKASVWLIPASPAAPYKCIMAGWNKLSPNAALTSLLELSSAVLQVVTEMRAQEKSDKTKASIGAGAKGPLAPPLCYHGPIKTFVKIVEGVKNKEVLGAEITDVVDDMHMDQVDDLSDSEEE